MIPKAITAPFRWWAKHPWIVFWGITFLVLIITIIPLSNDLLEICLSVLVMAWILSISQEVRRQSRIRAALAVVAFVITIIIGFIILMLVIYPQGRRFNYDADVKSNLRNAATAQEAYFVDHDTYTSNIGSLRGFNQSANVSINVEATTTTFVITGTATKRCKENTGTWSINSTTGAIEGTPCRY